MMTLLLRPDGVEKLLVTHCRLAERVTREHRVGLREMSPRECSPTRGEEKATVGISFRTLRYIRVQPSMNAIRVDTIERELCSGAFGFVWIAWGIWILRLRMDGGYR